MGQVNLMVGQVKLYAQLNTFILLLTLKYLYIILVFQVK